MPLIEDLERLAALHGDGVLTDEEFAVAKRKLINATGAPAPMPHPSAGLEAPRPAPIVSAAPFGTPTVDLQNNSAAVIGFVFGLLSIVLYTIGIIPVVAVVFGLIGLNSFEDDRHKNKWMAVTGLALGAAYCLVSLNHYGHLK